MAFLVTQATEKMLLDTLPAIKITNFNGILARDNIYSYAKMYVLEQSVQIGFTVFDETPPDTQRVAAAFNFAPDVCEDYLYFSCLPNGKVDATLVKPNEITKNVSKISATKTSGVDEQGYYWAIEFNISKDLILKYFGNSPFKNNMFCGNLFLYDTEEISFGSSFAIPIGNTLPTNIGFGEFVAVPY